MYYIWYLSIFYDSPYPSNKEPIWNFLVASRSSISHPWLLVEDYNDILFPLEVSGEKFYQGRADKFANMTANCILMDLGFKGHPFTWRHNYKSNFKVAKRLDRTLADLSWRMTFLKASILTSFPLTLIIILLVLFAMWVKKGDSPFGLKLLGQTIYSL